MKVLIKCGLSASLLLPVVFVGSSAKASETPSKPTASPGNEQVTLTFTQPVKSGHTLVNYLVRIYDTSAQVGSVECADGTSTPETCIVSTYNPTAGGSATLVNGTSYSFGVVPNWRDDSESTTAAGAESERSDVVIPYTTPATPAAPTASADSTVKTTVDVNWTAPHSNGESIDEYTVEVWDKSGTTKLTAFVGCTATTETTCQVTGLSNGSAYRFKVIATNLAGPSLPSDVSGVVTIAPGAPTGVAANVVVASSTVSVDVTWNEPASNVEAITGYTVTASPTATGTTLSDVTATWSSGDREVTFAVAESGTSSALQLGSPYLITVFATNTGGDGDESSGANVTPSRAPGVPLSPSGVASGNSVTVSWSAPTSNGGETISGYEANAFAGSADSTASPLSNKCTTTGALSCTITGLTSSTSYKFAIRAENTTNGFGDWSALSSSVSTAEETTTTTSTTTTTIASTTTIPSSTTPAAPVNVTTTVSPRTTVPVSDTPASPTSTTSTVPTKVTTTKEVLAGSPVPIARKPAATIATNVQLAVTSRQVKLSITVPKSRRPADQITSYVITIKPVKGKSVSRTIRVKPGTTVKPVVGAQKSTKYSLTMTAVTKAGKKRTWKGPSVTTTK